MTNIPVIKPYIVQNSEESVDKIFSVVNTSNYQGYSPDYKYVGVNKIVVDSLFNYQQLLSGLKQIPNLEFVTHRILHSQACPKNKIRVSIRHDVDSDIVAAVKQAEIERDLGIVSSWYILHTAPYYGYFQNKVFHRYRCMGYVYRYLQELGHEVALHTDSLLIYQEHQINGAEALVTEIEWLRSLGIDIKGTVAHNSRSVQKIIKYLKGLLPEEDYNQRVILLKIVKYFTRASGLHYSNLS